MKSRVSVIVSLMCLVASACSPALDQNAAKPPVQEAATKNGAECQSRAESRLSLFDRPSTYPISAEEKRNAYLALYNECMKEYEVQVATPKPNFEYASGGSGGELASLSPAAGGNTPQQPKAGIVSYANGAMVIDTSQLGNLSPSAGGKTAGITSTVTGNGSTVVVVQAPPSTAIAYPPPPTHPSAIPVPTGAAPAAAPATAAPVATTKAETPAETPKPAAAAKAKIAHKAHKATEKKEEVTADKRTRFQKNAVPLEVDLSARKDNLNALEPSAGKVLEKAVKTDKLPAKD